MKLKSDTILITGGSSGIGLEMAKQLISLGNTVIITGRDISKLELTKKELPSVHIYQSDVSDSQAICELYSKVTADFPKLNILINNAGIMRAVDFNDTEYDKICSEIDINLSGPIRMVQQFLPHLKKQPEAAIVNVSSGLAFITFPKTPIYGASKAGLHAYTKTLRLQLKNTSVKVFELAPPKTSAPLFNRDNPNVEKNNRMPTMDVPKVVTVAIGSIKRDKFEILPGLSKMLKLAGRFQL
ncbi:SDR family NAD(P)-dependent oxidoreductase [Desulfosporosinus sp. BG]|uniref:SDR family oxidoreductase n=1 Tax=Desulfosporosinus sp. BG TaxID=1633135 RepID=UPI00083ADB31|nr:SDR family NAD(P)-dependent oxidoreductase [Desulfosporosinus sp. BG]ODA40028.1 Sorbitol-6-phosphate 2-dehydrogenase [Desulfosporosinus sp. BG]